MSSQDKMNQVLEIMRQEGMKPEDIQKFIVTLNNMLSEQVYHRMMTTLSENDLSAIEALPEAQAKDEAVKRFAKVAGQSPQAISDELLAAYLDGFLAQAKAEKGEIK